MINAKLTDAVKNDRNMQPEKKKILLKKPIVNH